MNLRNYFILNFDYMNALNPLFQKTEALLTDALKDHKPVKSAINDYKEMKIQITLIQLKQILSCFGINVLKKLQIL